MTTYHLIVGSQQGNTEFMADELAAELKKLNFEAIVHEEPEYNEIPQQDCCWIICTSTFGMGEFPDNIQPFVTALTANKPDLSNVCCTVVGVGDSNYDAFCNAGKEMIKILTDLGAKIRVDPLLIDISSGDVPEETAVKWLNNWVK